MKKTIQHISLVDKNLETNKNIEINKIKTTNVNVLLNRVRLDQKKTLRKRIILSFILVSAVSCLAIYFII